jgi:hypothetical protein
VRTFDYKILDMLEFYLDAETFRRISQFKTEKVPVGTRPLMVFAGTALYEPTPLSSKIPAMLIPNSPTQPTANPPCQTPSQWPNQCC